MFDLAATNLLKVGETAEWGGGALAYMALSPEVEKSRGKYYGARPGASKEGDGAYGTSFNVDSVSKEVVEGEAKGKGRRLWELSEELVKIT